MKVIVFDRQQESNPLNGSVLGSADELETLFGKLETRDPFFCELLGENYRNLLIGLSSELGCVQYSSSNGLPPYLMAVGNDDPASIESFLDFFMGDTGTPISNRYWLPKQQVMEIAKHFIRTGDRSIDVAWEEI